MTPQKLTLLVAAIWSLVHLDFALAQEETAIQAQRRDFVSDASFIIGTYNPVARDHEAGAIATAANEFLDSLTPEQRKLAVHPLGSPERRQWTNLPARPNAGGVRMGDLNETQIKLVCDLMAGLFSPQGYNKIRDIMLADDQLLRGGQPRGGFGTENFSVVIFGEPSEAGSWAFQIDGHHVGANVSLNGSELTISPSFIGTQPQAFQIADQKFEPFAGETGDAYALVATLSDEQIKQAVLQLQRAQLVTGPGTDGKVPPARGVACSTFNDAQKQLLTKLIFNWIGDLPEKHADKRMEQIKAELDQIKFSWNGNKQPGSDISYTIHGPSLIIEYACQDLGGNPLAHLHSMYRDPTNEYGKQLD